MPCLATHKKRKKKKRVHKGILVNTNIKPYEQALAVRLRIPYSMPRPLHKPQTSCPSLSSRSSAPHCCIYQLCQNLLSQVYNRDGLLDKLGDISWPENVGWIHKLSIDIDQEQEVDVNDDLARELAFYTQALEGTRQAFEKLQSMGLPFLRPADYYAEMAKTDAHMEKVKGRLLAEKRKMEEAEERRKAREAKRLAKEIQAQKLKERAKQKKEDIESVKKWRKQRQQSGFAGSANDAELDLDFEDGKVFERSNKKRPGVSPGDRSGGKAKQAIGKGKKQKKREFRNSKFGFGGKKGLKKQNTAETTYEVRGFNKKNVPGNKKRKM